MRTHLHIYVHLGIVSHGFITILIYFMHNRYFRRLHIELHMWVEKNLHCQIKINMIVANKASKQNWQRKTYAISLLR